MESYDVCIVGAGISGLTVAYTLAQRGIDNFVILEASSVVGGRIRNAPEDLFDAGFPIAVGAEWLGTEDPSVFNEITGQSDTKVPLVEYRFFPANLYSKLLKCFLKLPWFNPLPGAEYKFANYGWYPFLSDFLLPFVPSTKILLEKQVVQVDYTDTDSVVLRTADAEDYRCNYVVVTASLQMLRSDKIAFSPPLSNERKEIMNAATFDEGFKLFMEFRDKFYPSTFVYYLDDSTRNIVSGEEALYADATQGQTTATKNILSLICSGSSCPEKYFSHHGYPDLISFVLSELDEMFQGKASRSIVKWYIEEWTAEAKPFVGGTYMRSYGNTGSLLCDNTKEQITTLSEPIQNRIFFAGEAYALDQRLGYAHTAALTGKEAAKLISAQINSVTSPPAP